MKEPELNTYQITLTVRDISKISAVVLAKEIRNLAKGTDAKSELGRWPEDVSVTVSHVKLMEGCLEP